MAIDIVPKPAEKKSIRGELLFYGSIILVIAAAAAYFVISNSLKNKEKTIESLGQELERLDSLPEAALEEKILAQQEKISDFANLVNGYRHTSNIFNFIENIIHPKILFTNFSVDSVRNIVQVTGSADNFQSLGQQLIIFKRADLVKEVTLSNIAIGNKERILFAFNLLIDPRVFAKQEENE
jgi:hypothetical protein